MPSFADEGLLWEVIQPSGRAGMGSAKPQGCVRIKASDGSREYINIPASASRLLARRKKAGEVSCSSRGELMCVINDTLHRAAKERVAQLIMRRDYAEKEMFQRLVADGFSSQDANEAIEYAASIGLVSNKRFADAFVRGKVSAGWGIERIVRELSRRGIDVNDLDGWPYDYLDPDEERERAWDAASRKHVREPNAYAKLVRFLVGRGFSYGVSTSVAKDILNGKNNS